MLVLLQRLKTNQAQEVEDASLLGLALLARKKIERDTVRHRRRACEEAQPARSARLGDGVEQRSAGGAVLQEGGAQPVDLYRRNSQRARESVPYKGKKRGQSRDEHSACLAVSDVPEIGD